MGCSPDAGTRRAVNTRGMPKLRANGVGLYYEEHGDGEPILCIHGTGSSAAMWADAVAELAKRGRAIAYDRRGFSRSERPEPLVMDVHLHADDAAALLEALDVGPAIVVGRSQGGEIAVDLALRHPDRVRALVLLEGGALGLSVAEAGWLAGVTEQVLAAAEADVSVVGETLLRCVVGDEGWEAMPEPVQRMFEDNGPAIAAEVHGGLLDVSAEELGTIARPALLLSGEQSPPVFAEVTRIMAAAMPSAVVEWVEGGHIVDPAHPAVLAFLDEVLSPSSRRPVRAEPFRA